MRIILSTILAGLLLAGDAFGDGRDRGIVKSVDGKGGFVVETEKNGTIAFMANKRLHLPDPKTKTLAYPDHYGRLMPNDLIDILWGTDQKTGQEIAEGIKVIKRLAPEGAAP